jgi:hypothetical protein
MKLHNAYKSIQDSSTSLISFICKTFQNLEGHQEGDLEGYTPPHHPNRVEGCLLEKIQLPSEEIVKFQISIMIK